jgi:L-rhamnonate dehydratase
MNLKEIRAAEIILRPNPKTPPRAPSASQRLTTARPVDRYGHLRGSPGAHPSWRRVACVATAEDGTWGLGITNFGRPVAAVINDHFAPLLAGQPCLATEKLWDMMARLTAPYGGAGLASYAISAIDTALWDLKGKLLGRPPEGPHLLLRDRV